MSLRSQTVSGVGWSFYGRFIQQGIKLALTIFLMRLLGTEAFGLIGMALVFIGFGNLFKKMGFGAALVQRSKLSESHYTSTFFFNIGIGLLFTCLLIYTAPLIARFYTAPDLTLILKVLSLNFVIGAFGIVPQAVLERSMQFNILSKIQIGTAAGSGIIVVIAAYAGVGVWALVIESMLTTLFNSILFLIFSNWRPKLSFSWRAISHLWSYSSNLVGFHFINYWSRQLDDLLIGKYMGASSLGIYTRAYFLMLLPNKQVISVISRVMFSALSKIKHEKKKVKKVYLRAMGILSFIIFPMMIGLFVVAEPFVLALFGQKWSGMIPIVQILSWIGVIQTLNNPTGWLYQSQGKTNWMFWIGVFGSGTLIVGIIIGVWLGSIESVAISYGVANVLITYPFITIAGKLINMNFMEVIKKVFPSFLLSLVMAIIVYGSSFLITTDSFLLELIVEVTVGVTVYVILASLFDIKAYNELKTIALEIYTDFKNKRSKS
jgi:PST family polysaccharide transporter